MTGFIQRFRGALAAAGLIVRPTADTPDTDSPSLTSGSGAPAATEPNGSLYARTTGKIYQRVSGAWQDLMDAAVHLITDTGNYYAGANVEAALQEVGADFALLKTGQLTVANGTNSGTAVVGTAYNGKPAFACMNAQDGTIHVVGAVVASGTLTVGLSGNVTADRLVGYFIDGR